MNKPIQKRAIKTHTKLVKAAETVIRESGYGALRVEEVVRRASVAKGTFFAHFRDKDALLEHFIGAEMDAIVNEMDQRSLPGSAREAYIMLVPLIEYMTAERYVFDLILRHSGAAVRDEIGPIAMNFHAQAELFARWATHDNFRKDIPEDQVASGIQAFLLHRMALKFCALSSHASLEDRLMPLLTAWLEPHCQNQLKTLA